MTLKEDPHFEQIVNEIKEIESTVDGILFGSVFLRQPRGGEDDGQAPPVPEGTPSLEESLLVVDEQLQKSADLEDRLKGLLDDQNNAQFEDQIEDYLRDLEDIEKSLRRLKPALTPELLRNGEAGKTDVSWLSWRRQTLASKLHKEIVILQELTEDEPPEREKLETKLKTIEALIKTANTLHQSAQYLSWFNDQVVAYNESLPEIDRDFTTSLVSQWVQEEANKVLEHLNNCTNVRSELEESAQKEQQSAEDN